MNANTHDINRRRFIQLTSAGLLTAISAPLFATSDNAPFDFRKGAKEIALHFNENSLGMSPNAYLAAREAVTKFGNRYADGAVNSLRQMLADQHGVGLDQIMLGNGSTDVIRGIIAIAAQHKATIIEPSPTFGDVRRYARSHGLNVISVPVGKGFETDISALKFEADRHKGNILINLCNPNNPTGTIVNKDVLNKWILQAPANVMFLVDEAYHEYAILNDQYASALPLIKQGRDNLFITRTFSKIYGMAGMRIGYGIASQKSAKAVGQFTPGFNLNVAGAEAAIASLKDTAFFAKSQSSNTESRNILNATLDKLGLQYIPSNTNFVLHQISGSVADYQSRMLANGIKVGRRMTKEDGWNRVSLGTPEEMRIFTRTLEAFREKGWV